MVIFVSEECHTLSFTNPLRYVERVYFSREDVYKKIEEGIRDLEKQNVIMIYGSVGDHTIYNYPMFKVLEIENPEKYKKPQVIKFEPLTAWVERVNPVLYKKLQKELKRRQKLEHAQLIKDQKDRIAREKQMLKMLNTKRSR